MYNFIFFGVQEFKSDASLRSSLHLVNYHLHLVAHHSSLITCRSSLVARNM